MEERNQTQSDASRTALEACERTKQQLGEQLSYLTADFENFRRRTEKDRLQWNTFAQAEVIKKILPIVDDFDRAFHDNTTSAQVQAHLQGFELVYKALQKTLKELKVEEITQQDHFDPELHEAVMNVAVEGKESGSVAQVLQKGYTFKGVVLRPAQVSIVA